MSDFDSNPFADPEAANPFADPAVQQAANAQRTTRTNSGLDEFNPFAAGNTTRQTGGGTVPPPAQPTPAMTTPQTQPAVMMPSEAPPPYTPSGAQRVDTESLQKQQEELERRAQELQRKEQQMRDAQSGVRTNNWPPLPAKCCFGPCFYQDFAIDIPLEFQRVVKSLYYLWMFYSCVLILNVLGSLAYFISNSSGGVTFGLSILFLVLFTPCSFVCWYRPVYKAFRSDSSVNFFLFFFIFFFQFCVNVVQALGIDSFGTCGWINGIKTVGYNKAVGAIMLVIGGCFTIVAVGSIFFLIKVHRIYRSTGASFDKAKQEFRQGVMSNEHVQTGVSDLAAGAARNAMSGNAGGNRY
ncbi:secretory carrier-associated membrane protein 2-like isoform X2 [Tubulanus polymorphus]|uniref:secretory carrier-associated membrane protein 2-like isoform X2 n=1 Tax=Tubulanus polymorphus TaxID=672921 RepID=UPI003DA3378B